MQFHFEKRYPLNSRVGRAVTAVFLIVSILAGLFCLSRSREFDRQLEAGELLELQATVERIRVSGKGDNRDYDVWVSYSFRGRNYENVHLSWYSSEMEEGEPTAIYISPDAPGEPLSDAAEIFGFVSIVFVGCALLCFAVAWIPWKKEE